MYPEQKRLDTLFKVANIGFAKAGDALSTLLQKSIILRVPEIKTVPFENIVKDFEEKGTIQVVIFLRIEGPAPGKMALFFPLESAEFIVRALYLHDAPIDLYNDEMTQSALMEVGNIMVSSFVTALSDHAGISLLPSIPAIAIDLAGAIMDAILLEEGVLEDEVLLIDTLISGGTSIQGQLVFFPNKGSIEKLFGNL